MHTNTHRRVVVVWIIPIFPCEHPMQVAYSGLKIIRPTPRRVRLYDSYQVANSHGPTDAGPETLLHWGDKVALAGRNEIPASVENPLSIYEIDDPDLLDTAS
jgi:hypothetical protein